MHFPFGNATFLAILLLVLFTLFFFGFWSMWYRRGRLGEVVTRPLAPLEFLRSSLNRMAEMGESVHISPGSGILHERNSVAETMAGLEVTRQVAQDALSLGVPVRVTTNDALVSLVAGTAVEQALRAAGDPPDLSAEVDWVAQQNPVAYAAGVVGILGRPEVQGNVLVGALGDELLLIGQVGVEKTAFQMVGAARPAAASLLPLVTDHYLLGEEIFAAGAYLDPRPARIVSLLAQDGIRMVILVLITLGVILATFGALESTLGPLLLMPAR